MGIEKYFGEEDHLHIQVCNYLKFQYPNVLFHHSPNEGKRGYVQQAKIKAMGVKAGFPDLIIMFGGRNLALELKTEKGRPTTWQKKWMEELKDNGWTAEIAYGFLEAKNIIDRFLCYA